MDKNFSRHLRRGMEILRRQGLKAFLNKVKVKISERQTSFTVPVNEEILTYKSVDQSQKADLLAENDHFLAVHLHLYYEDLLPEFVRALSNVPVSFDLFISIQDRKEENEKHIALVKEGCKTVSNLRSLEVLAAQNRGRDIAPMYVLFAKELRSYRYVLHMHSKKSLYTGTEQEDWRQYSVNTLIGSREKAERLLQFMESHPEIGLVYPERFDEMAPEAYGWLSDGSVGKAFLESLGVPFHGGVFLYPAGSFFLVRNEAIRQIWDRWLTYEDFEAENGQTDGTLAHVLERAVSLIARFNGYHEAILSDKRKEIHIDRDRQTFEPVFRRNLNHILLDLSAYDVISFDIFDCLLTRPLYHPGDLFLLMEEKNPCLPKGFAEARLAADREALSRFGAKTDLSLIYQILKKELSISAQEADALQEEEVSLESSLLKPRRDMVRLYQTLLENGKRLILVSDMYLPPEVMEPILAQNGITGYEHLYLSCREGHRKDDGSLWDQVLSDYQGLLLAHIGDNQQSDWQMLSDRKEKTTWIMNPRDEEEIDGKAEIRQAAEKVTDPVERSILMGIYCNMGAYNSPFSMSIDGQFRFQDPYTFGMTVFGPLIYEYLTWLHERARGLGIKRIAFLAREGYLFRQIYEEIYGKEALPSIYLLTSRRAVSVAAIRSEDDILEILRRDYDGSLRNLLISRLGLPEDEAEKIQDRQMHFRIGAVDDDFDRTIADIRHLFPGILANAREERKEYLDYLKKELWGKPDDNLKNASGGDIDENTETIDEKTLSQILLVDIGYAGTIQYWMSRLLKKPLAAAYLGVIQENPRLKELHCSVEAMYRDDNRKENNNFIDVIKRSQLYLESVLQAPYGQLIHFKNGCPIYRKEKKPGREIQKLQQGMKDYAKLRSSLEGCRYGSMNALPKETKEESRTFVETVYCTCLKEPLTANLSGIFSVEDNYSQDASLHLDPRSGKWVI